MNEPLTAEKVSKALLSFAEEELEWGSYGEFINYRGDARGETWEVPELGTVTIVDYHDYDTNKNYDSWVEQMWIIFEVQGTLYKAKGTYMSFAGSEWEDEVTIVKPKAVEVIVYEEI
jgi:hypothetical protein